LQKESYEQLSALLTARAAQLAPEELPGFLEQIRPELVTSPRPFADYLRRKLREKGALQQNVFLAADLSENYGYKLISGEKHTRQRDTVLRLCLAARLAPEEVQEALTLYGMAPLYGRFPRDAILLSASGSGLRDMQEVNRLLERLGQPPLLRDYI